MNKHDPFAVVHAAAEEERVDASYQWNNARRGDADRLVIQRTISGAAHFRNSSGDHLVPAGSAMLFTHREPTSYGYPADGTEPYRHRFLAFSPSGIRALFDHLRHDFGPIVSMPDNSEATALFDELFKAHRNRRVRDRFHESELLYRLLIALYRQQVQRARISDPVEYGYHLIQDHFRSLVNLKTIAAKCDVSREHFIRAFAARYQESPGVMLRRLRLEHARTLLSATDMSVADVARSSGFTSSNTFCRAYRRAFQCSPGESR